MGRMVLTKNLLGKISIKGIDLKQMHNSTKEKTNRDGCKKGVTVYGRESGQKALAIIEN